MDDVKSSIISLLDINPGGLTIKNLEREYEETEGKHIDYRRLGYESLTALVKSIPSLKFSSKFGELIVQSEADEKTAHLTEFIKNQKKPTKKGRKKRFVDNHVSTCQAFSYRQKHSKNISSNTSNGSWQKGNDHSQSAQYSREKENQQRQKYSKNISSNTSNGSWQKGNDHSQSTQYSREKENQQPNSKRKLLCYGRLYSDIMLEEKSRKESVPKPTIVEETKSKSEPRSNFDKSKLLEKDRSYGDLKYTNKNIECSSSDVENGFPNKILSVTISRDNTRKISLSRRFGELKLDQMTRFNTYEDEKIKNHDSKLDNVNVDAFMDNEVNTEILSSNYTPQALLVKGLEMNKKMLTRSASVIGDFGFMKPTGFENDTLNFHFRPQSSLADSYPASIPQTPLPYSMSSPIPNYSTPPPPPLPPPPTTPTPPPPTPLPNYSTRPQPLPTIIVPYLVPLPPVKSPVSTIIPPSSERFSLKEDESSDNNKSCENLLELTRLHGLPAPVYNVQKHISKRNEPFVFCKIKVGNHSYSSFPNDAPTVERAKELAAIKACQHLNEYLRLEALKKHAPKRTQIETIILDRIVETIKGSKFGLFAKSVEETYIKRYTDCLPHNWLELVKKSSKLVVEDTLGGPIISFYSSLPDTVESLPDLVLPKNDEWGIFITCSYSINNIYFRILGDGYGREYGDLAKKMNEFYRDFQTVFSPTDVKIGSYYVALFKDDCLRVKVQGVTSDGKIKCFLLDNGGVDIFNKVFPLVERFATLAPQAISCSLTGLEEFNGVITAEILNFLLTGNSYVAHVDNRDLNNLKLTIYDTSSDEDVNVNEFLKTNIQDIASISKESVEEQTSDVVLASFITAEQIFVQPVTEEWERLKQLIAEAGQKIEGDILSYKLISTSEIVKEKMYLVNYFSSWYRIHIKKIVSDNEVTVQYVDYGYVETITLNNIMSLDGLPNELKTIPKQVMKVRLYNISEMEVSNESVLKVQDIITENETLLMKVIDKSGPIPVVELFKKTSDALQSLNDYILQCSSESTKEVAEHLKEVTEKDHENAMSSVDFSEFCKPLTRFPWEEKTFLKVYITLCASPSNFYLQPCHLREKLNELTKCMNDSYTLEADSDILIPNKSDLKPNNVFACKSNDNWQRVSICKLIDATDVSVNLVDYGSVEITSINNLRYLHPDFTQIPSTCENAELAGIIPEGGDWDPRAAIIFQKIVQNKTFAALICDQSDEKLYVRLYDIVTDDHVVDISYSLIEQNYAKDVIAD